MKNMKSIRTKLFITLCIVVVVIIVFLILLNNVVLETYYLYTKEKSLENLYNEVNYYYSENSSNEELQKRLEKISINNNYDIILITDENISIYTSNSNFINNLENTGNIENNIIFNKRDILYKNEKIIIKKMRDKTTEINFIVLTGTLDNGYILYARIPISPIKESVKISNDFLYLIGGFTIIIGGVVVSIISRKFTKPILEINNIAKKMANLDFSEKYEEKNTHDEINELRKKCKYAFR